MTAFFRKLGWVAKRRSREEQLAEELRFHLEEEADERRETGLGEDDAHWAARRELGNLAAIQEETRAAWGWTLAEQWIQDLRYAARMIVRNPAFTVLAATSLALGIGANTAICSFMDALLMRRLPVRDPASLALLKWHVTGGKTLRGSVIDDVSGYFYDDPKTGKTTEIFPYPAYEMLRKSTGVLSDLFAYRQAGKLNLMMQGEADVVNGEYVSGNYFQGLGVAPGAGRLIRDDDDRAGAEPVLVLSYGYAQKRFGDPARAAGQPVTVNHLPFIAIGVAPAGFYGVDPSRAPDFYLPLHDDLRIEKAGAQYLDNHYYWIEMMGRLRPGVTIASAQAALAALFEPWVASTARNDRERRNLPEFFLMSGAGGIDKLRREYAQPLFVLLAMVGLILAIACANIANLLLARATARRREMAVRLSMGAGRGRVIRQLLTESLLLACIGGALGILLGMWGVRFLTLLLPHNGASVATQPELNWHVLAAAFALTVITGLLFGLAPALQATRVDVMPVLKESRTGERRRRMRFSLSQILVVSQIALSLLLLVGAGLFVRTLSKLESLEMGFRRENLLVFRINARQAGHGDPEILSFYSGLARRFAAIPGARASAVANSPLIGDGAWGWPVVPAGKEPPALAPSGHGSGMAATSTRVLATGPGFFSALQIPLVAGREFDEHDRVGSLPVAIVNEAWLKTNLPEGNPIGRHVVSTPPDKKPQEMEIVGVVKNARYDDLTGDFPSVVYMPFCQNLNVHAAEMTYFLRTSGDPLAYAADVRAIVHQADARVPVTNLGTQAAQIDDEISQQILFARLCTGFALLALAIACVGLYGTMSYMVARKTGEIGIRMALGARRGPVVWMVLRQVLVMAAIGLVIGFPVAYGLSRLVESLLYGIRPNDPAALAIAAATLIAAAVLAGYAPARRASRIDPIAALRHE
ncbi:MAG: ABC transporter permease [Acidobacteriia bacterium]|nr:ABC transporter permease [Terriglobia bacterium]